MNLKITYDDKKILFIVIFVSSLLISNMLAVKIWDAGVWWIMGTCAILTFPIDYLVSDVITEVYGYDTAKKTIFIAFCMNILLVALTTLAVYMPYPSTWAGQEAFSYVFTFTPRVLLASLIGYVCGQLVNAKLMEKIKTIAPKHLFVRTIGSTIGGEIVDTALFVIICFFDTMSCYELFVFIMCAYVFKVVWEIIAQPITYKAINWARK